jgi:hypothetical protein
VAAVAAGGCSGVPSGGPVRVVRAVPADGPDLPEARVIRRLATRPKENAPPAEIVRGYLTAQSDAQNDFAIARTYLAPRAAWNPGSQAVVYSSSRIGATTTAAGGSTVAATFDRVGTISPQGEFRPAEPAAASVAFRLVRVNGLGWRLSTVPSGVLLNRDELGGAYQRTTLYFPDSAHRLVPDPVFLPADVAPVTAATRALLAGPRTWLAPAVRTAIPAGTELIDPPEVVDGVVTLNFSREIRRTPQDSLGALVAQLVWTLTEPSVQVRAVRVLSEKDPIAVPGRAGAREYTRADWADYAPAPQTVDERLFFVRGGAPYAVDAAGREGQVAKTAPLVSVAVNRAGTWLAGLTRPLRGRQSLVLVDLTGTRPVRTALTADRITTPAWEPAGDTVWVADSSGGTEQVVAVPAAGGAPAPVGAALAGTVTSLRLSPDGARAALVVAGGRTSALYLARVERTAAGSRVLAAPRRVAPSIGGVTAVTFDGATQLTLAATVGPRSQLYRVDIDGFNLLRQRDGGLPRGAVTALTASGNDPPDRVASVAGRLWRRAPGADWIALPGSGTAGTYAC